MKKDIKEIALIYTIVILTVWLTCLNYETSKRVQQLKDEIIEVKKVAIELNDSKNNYIDMLQSMNNYADELEGEIKQYKELQRIKKDLDRSWQ